MIFFLQRPTVVLGLLSTTKAHKQTETQVLEIVKQVMTS